MTTSQISYIIDKLQKTLATHPPAMSTSYVKGLNSYSLSDMSPSISSFEYDASHIISYDSQPFTFLNPASYMSFMIIDDTYMPLLGIGYISPSKISFSNVYYIPNLTLSIVSVS